MEQELEDLLDKYEFENTILILPKNIKSSSVINLLKDFEEDIENNKITIITSQSQSQSQNHNKEKSKTRIKNRFRSKNLSKINKINKSSSNRLILTNQKLKPNSNKVTPPTNHTNHTKPTKPKLEFHNSNLEIDKKLKTFINLLKKTIKENILKNNNCVLENNKHIISSISHQFKTPINGLTTGVYVLENYLTNDFFKKILKHLLNCCLELNIFINDIIDYHLLKTDNINFNFSKINFKQILESLKEYYKEELELKNNTLKINNLVNTEFWSDTIRIKQILRYLVSNSNKHTKNGVIEININNQNQKQNQNLITFTVIDDGIGIPEKEKKNVFKPFYQIDCENNKWMTTQEGLGLGLTNSKYLSKQLGGDIFFKLNSETNKTTIEFTIENKIVKQQQQQQQSNILNNTNNDNNEDKTNILNILNILIIEDNVMNGQLIKLMINNLLDNAEKYENTDKIKTNIKLITESEHSIPKLINNEYDLVFLDLKMPNLSGFQILDLIESNKKLKEKYFNKIVVITALANNTEVSQLQTYSIVFSIVFKPFEMKQIKKIIYLKKKLINKTNQ